MKIDNDSDLDALLDSPERPGAQECHVCWALARLKPDTAEKMRAIIARPDIRSGKIREAFAARLDFAPGDATIQRHRTGACTR